MTAVVPSSWHVCGTPTAVAAEVIVTDRKGRPSGGKTWPRPSSTYRQTQTFTLCEQDSSTGEARMSNQDEDLLFSHNEDQPASVRLASSRLTPKAASKIASEMHRWGRMTGVFSIIVLVIWLVLGTATTTGFLAARSSLLWPGVVLAILAAIGLFGGFRFDYVAGRKR
jgi:hypothetical protein